MDCKFHAFFEVIKKKSGKQGERREKNQEGAKIFLDICGIFPHLLHNFDILNFDKKPR